MRRPHSKPSAPEGAVVEVLNRRAQIVLSLLLHDLVRPPQCDYPQPQTALLEVQQLVKDERFRKTREAVDQNDEIDLPATSIRPICARQSVKHDDDSCARKPA
jgi:hypothetical protein